MKFCIVLYLSSVVWQNVNGQALERCYRCAGIDVKEKEKCRVDFDYCTTQERCLLMEYKGPNGYNIYDAMCKQKSECDSNAAEEELCMLRENCVVHECCSENLCNYASGTWLRFDITMLLIVVMTMFRLWQQI